MRSALFTVTIEGRYSRLSITASTSSSIVRSCGMVTFALT